MDYIDLRQGHRGMVDAVEAGIKNPKTALGYLELGAKVLDSTEDTPAAEILILGAASSSTHPVPFGEPGRLGL